MPGQGRFTNNHCPTNGTGRIRRNKPRQEKTAGERNGGRLDVIVDNAEEEQVYKLLGKAARRRKIIGFRMPTKKERGRGINFVVIMAGGLEIRLRYNIDLSEVDEKPIAIFMPNRQAKERTEVNRLVAELHRCCLEFSKIG